MEMGGASMDPAVREGLARSWKALMAVGMIAIVVGCVAILVPAVASVGTAIFIGWILLIAGAFLVAGAFTAHSVGTVVLRLLWALPHGRRRHLSDRRTAQRDPDPDPRPRHLLPLHGPDPGHRRLPRPRPAKRRPGRPQRLRRPPDRDPDPRQVPQLRRLGDRPPGRHRPDICGLDARFGCPGRQRPLRAPRPSSSRPETSSVVQVQRPTPLSGRSGGRTTARDPLRMAS